MPNALPLSDALLACLRGSMRPLVCVYDRAELKESKTVSAEKTSLRGASFTCALSEDKSGEAVVLEAVFTVVQGEGESVGVALAFDFSDWSRENYVMVPAAIYHGNRFRAIGVELPAPEGTEGIELGKGYCPDYPADMYFNPHLPLTFSDNPRLSLVKGAASKIELLTGNAATPAMCFYSPVLRRGFILLCGQKTRFGNNGLFIEENAEQDKASFTVSAPGVRRYAARFGGFRESGDRGTILRQGDTITLGCKLFAFNCSDIPELLEKFMQTRKDFTGTNAPRNLAPMSAILNAARARADAGLWNERGFASYYSSEYSATTHLFQLGWTGGMTNTFPMLAMGDDLHRLRVAQTLDFVVKFLPGESGFLYGILNKNREFEGEPGKRPPQVPQITMTRKNSDALLWFIKHFQLFEALGLSADVKREWKDAARNLACAFVHIWDEHGEFGQYVDAEAGTIVVFNSTAGAVAPGGLVLAAQYFGDLDFLRVAKASALMYYERDVAGLGLTGGHSGDTSQDADADSAYGFVESLMRLHEATGDPLWAQRARVTACLAASWTLSYDYVYPEHSQLAQLGARTAGAVWASVQNKHAAPGICTLSGDCLLKLFRATGETRWIELLRDIQHAHTEAVDMPGKVTNGCGFGASMERIQPTDGEGSGSVGNFCGVEVSADRSHYGSDVPKFIAFSSGWTECNGMLMALELPGVYINPDTGFLYVIDHIEAELIDGGSVLRLVNRTPFDAEVTILVETRAAAQKPLGTAAFLRWPRVKVKAGESVSNPLEEWTKCTPLGSR